MVTPMMFDSNFSQQDLIDIFSIFEDTEGEEEFLGFKLSDWMSELKDFTWSNIGGI